MDQQKVDGVGLFSFTKPVWADKCPPRLCQVDIDGDVVSLFKFIYLVDRCREVDSSGIISFNQMMIIPRIIALTIFQVKSGFCCTGIEKTFSIS